MGAAAVGRVVGKLCGCVVGTSQVVGSGLKSGSQSGSGVCGPGASLGFLGGRGWGWEEALQDGPPGQGEGDSQPIVACSRDLGPTPVRGM